MATGKVVNGVFVPFTAEEQAAWNASQPSAAEVLAAERAEAVAAVKIEARRRMTLITGGGDHELRALRWAATIADLRAHDYPSPGALPEPWATRESVVQAAAVAVEAIAAASDSIESDVSTLADIAAVHDWRVALPTDERWP